MTDTNALPHMVTRFAPSPTGRLHVGHGWSALLAMDMARAAGGAFRLRIEDIDGTRSRPEHVAGIIEDLTWLGVVWDGDVVFQSQRLEAYEAALDQLRAMGLLYPCFCTRSDNSLGYTPGKLFFAVFTQHKTDVFYVGLCQPCSCADA